VDLVPGSGVVRISVTASTASTAAAVLQVQVEQLQDSGLLAPAGEFRLVGDLNGPASRVSPDGLLTTGLAAAAAVLVGLLTVAAVNVLRPRILTIEDVERVVRGVTEEPLPVQSIRRREGVELLAQRVARDHPKATGATLVTVGARPAPGGLEEQLASTLASKHSQSAEPGTTPSSVAVVVARLRHCTPDGLALALLTAMNDGRPVAGVAVR
jgi:hypothetical protein